VRGSLLPPELLNATWSRLTSVERAALRRRIRRGSRIDRQHWERVRNAEQSYVRQLTEVADNISALINTFTPGDASHLDQLRETLDRYSFLLEPWARIVAERMVADVMTRDANAWFRTSQEIGTNLKAVVETTPLGGAMRKLVEDQVQLIRSLPLDAARRVQQFTNDFMLGGKRYDELVDLIRQTGPVTVNRATLIARTETAKAQSAVVQARAQHIGAEQYIWHTVRDTAVRLEHRKLEGSVQRWDDPPVAEANGERHHPGNFPNCRCYAEPLLPAVIA